MQSVARTTVRSLDFDGAALADSQAFAAMAGGAAARAVTQTAASAASERR